MTQEGLLTLNNNHRYRRKCQIKHIKIKMKYFSLVALCSLMLFACGQQAPSPSPSDQQAEGPIGQKTTKTTQKTFGDLTIEISNKGLEGACTAQ